MREKVSVFLVLLSIIFWFFATDGISQKITGELRNTNREIIPGGKIIAIQNETNTEQQYATKNGTFELTLHPGQATIIYQASGYEKLEDKITVASEDIKLVKILKRNSVGGGWTLLLLIPGVCGLLVAWCKEWFCKNRIAIKSIQDRLLVALLNGIVWAGVLAWIWYGAADQNGITRIQFFSSSLTFEFFVPLLGYFGALLYVFDLFRGNDSDKFKEKEFGMRIVMGPYVAIIMVSLFGKDLSFVDLETHTGQGTLAFLSGLIVVVAFQGLIERANEILGRWRRERSPYEPTPLAVKFHLSEDEDNELRKISLKHPEQLPMWSIDELNEKASGINFDKNHLLKMKKDVESEELRKDIGGLTWERLKPSNITTLQEFVILSDAQIQNFAKEEPELSDERLIELKDKIYNFLNSNGG